MTKEHLSNLFSIICIIKEDSYKSDDSYPKINQSQVNSVFKTKRVINIHDDLIGETGEREKHV